MTVARRGAEKGIISVADQAILEAMESLRLQVISVDSFPDYGAAAASSFDENPKAGCAA